MSKQNKGGETSCDPKEAASLAASSILNYFKEHKWKIISFFPNASCVGRDCPLEKNKKK